MANNKKNDAITAMEDDFNGLQQRKRIYYLSTI